MSGGKSRSTAAALTLSSIAKVAGRALGCARTERNRGHALHAGARRSVGPQPPGEGIERGVRPGGLDLHATGGIPNPTGQAKLGREAPDEGPEPDALDHALDRDGTGGGATCPIAGRDASLRAA